MLGILPDPLVYLHARFRLPPETQLRCVNLIDRVSYARAISLAKLQAVCITCLFVASTDLICTFVTRLFNPPPSPNSLEEISRRTRARAGR